MMHWNIKPDSPAWHAIRAKNVGSSEVAGLVARQAGWGMSRYTLYQVKAGIIPPPPVDDSPGSLVWFGKRLEPTIGPMAAELNGWDIVPGPYATDDQCAGSGASLDFLIKQPGPEELRLGFVGPGVLETKNIGLVQFFRDWTGGEPPAHIIAQLQHLLGCSGCAWGAVAPLVNGNEIPVYRYTARPALIDGIRHEVTEFWASVRDRRPPPIDGSESTADTLKTLFPPRPADAAVDLTGDNEMPGLAAAWLIAQANSKASEAAFQEIKNQIAFKMAGRKHAVCSGYEIRGTFTGESDGSRAGDLPPDKIIGARKASLWWKVREVFVSKHELGARAA
jgi:predicted phage-related endonuclease